MPPIPPSLPPDPSPPPDPGRALYPDPAETNLLVRSPKKLARPKPGELPMDMNRLALYHDAPNNAEYQRAAKDLLFRCGPLVLDGVQYSYDPAKDRIGAVPVEFLGMERQRLAAGIEKLKLDSV